MIDPEKEHLWLDPAEHIHQAESLVTRWQDEIDAAKGKGAAYITVAMDMLAPTAALASALAQIAIAKLMLVDQAMKIDDERKAAEPLVEDGSCGVPHGVISAIRCDQAEGHVGMHLNSTVAGAFW